ncbi:MAG: hypothetical protein MZV64_26560 [Ignavibacteriales bacterium]|nr:hypothetical protein [Ignavibacteriales bacterium]
MAENQIKEMLKKQRRNIIAGPNKGFTEGFYNPQGIKLTLEPKNFLDKLCLLIKRPKVVIPKQGEDLYRLTQNVKKLLSSCGKN